MKGMPAQMTAFDAMYAIAADEGRGEALGQVKQRDRFGFPVISGLILGIG